MKPILALLLVANASVAIAADSANSPSDYVGRTVMTDSANKKDRGGVVAGERIIKAADGKCYKETAQFLILSNDTAGEGGAIQLPGSDVATEPSVCPTE